MPTAVHHVKLPGIKHACRGKRGLKTTVSGLQQLPRQIIPLFSALNRTPAPGTLPAQAHSLSLLRAPGTLPGIHLIYRRSSFMLFYTTWIHHSMQKGYQCSSNMCRVAAWHSTPCWLFPGSMASTSSATSTTFQRSAALTPAHLLPRIPHASWKRLFPFSPRCALLEDLCEICMWTWAEKTLRSILGAFLA